MGCTSSESCQRQDIYNFHLERLPVEISECAYNNRPLYDTDDDHGGRRKQARTLTHVARFQDDATNALRPSTNPANMNDLNHTKSQTQGYELSEDEINISLDEFRSQVTDSNGSIMYAHSSIIHTGASANSKPPNSKTKMNFSARPSQIMLAKYTALPTKAHPEPQEPTIGTIWVEFPTESAIGIKHLRAFATFLHERHFYSGIYVAGAPVTTSALKQSANLPITIEVFQEQDLLVNITKHELVPKHILLSPEEKKALLERYRLKETQLPRIRVEDPVAKYLGLRRGQVVKIIRKSETAGRYASYRWAI